jgi:hypothetical protein
VGGTRERQFDGTNFKPRKVLENAHAQRPTTLVPALARGSGARCVGWLVETIFAGIG